MSKMTYDEALKRVLAHEGGYTNHPADPGGPTNYGITIADYRRHVKPGATAADVRAMKVEEAKAIYRAKYWDALRCDDLPAGVDYAVFDYGVNSGIGRAARVLQRVLGLADDGQIGPQTIAALRPRDAKVVVAAICDERLAFLRHLGTWPVFGKGWGRRVAEVRAESLRMADNAHRPAPVASAPAVGAATGKGMVPVNAAAQTGAAAGVIVTGATAAAQANHAPTIITIAVATLLAAVGAWLFWRWRQQRQQLAPTISSQGASQ